MPTLYAPCPCNESHTPTRYQLNAHIISSTPEIMCAFSSYLVSQICPVWTPVQIKSVHSYSEWKNNTVKLTAPSFNTSVPNLQQKRHMSSKEHLTH
jgi:hypothetical protein